MLFGDRFPVVRAARGTAAVAAALLAVLGLAGCAVTDSAAPHEPAANESRLRELTTREEILVDRAEQLLVKACMERAGFRFWVTPVESADHRKGSGFVLDDVRWAREFGYGGQLRRDAEKARRDGPNTTYVNALTPRERGRYRETLDGTPSKGMLSAALPGGGTVETPRESCQARAKDELYGDFETWFRAEKVATNLTPLYVPDLSADKRFTRALSAWSACMERKGRSYADPFEVREDLGRLTAGLSGTAAHGVEVDLAVDEAACARSSSLADTARTLEDEYRARKTRRFSDDIATFRRMRLTASDRARDIARR
ncbi:hypothetical protein [Streptomyces zingiberis]|uniref:Lipoprotein n=1 Tax=Streptomyces zingiberis TaxID=2053010 RepID=A0ABX1BPE4_9ACTN|nr:hypothetical protein [Streptomyces zingiberis]NJP99579.1 hypothetical protein [Streptomyces zingiberis]